MTLQVLENASLRTLNTFGVEARARRLVVLDDEDELPRALSLIATEPGPLVLGGGSNLLIVGDVEGTVLQLRTRGRRRLPPGPGQSPGLTRVALSAGEVWDDAVNWTLAEGLPAAPEALSLEAMTEARALAASLDETDPELAKALRASWGRPVRSLAFRNAAHQKERD